MKKFMRQKGFSLIELMVVLAVFMLVIGVAVSIFVSIIQYQKSILLEQELLNQISYASEYISRVVRMALKDETGNCLGGAYAGYHYLLTHYDASTGFYQGIQFVSSDGVCQEFFFDSGDGNLKEIKDGELPQSLISEKFQVQYVRFVINGDKNLQGASENDAAQPRVTMVMNAKIGIVGNLQERIIQTTVSQRNLNL